MVNFLGPGAFGCARSAASRPVFTPSNLPGDVADWFKDCTSPLDRDGTEWRAALLNFLIANLRSVVTGAGLTPSNLDDAIIARALQSGGMNWAVATGTANNWTVALNLALAAYAAGRVLWIKAPATNTSTTVVATIDGLAARPVKKADGSNPAVGDLLSGRWYPTIDDGTNICVLGTLPSDVTALRGGQVFTANGTLTIPAGVTLIRLRAWGGGAGGGGITASGGAGGGGGGGEYREGLFAVVPGAAHAVTIGAGGNGGANTGAAGAAGGSTSVGTLVTAAGGSPGAGGNGTYGVGGIGGTGGSGGSFNQNGGSGSNGGAIGAVAQSGSGGGAWMVTNHYLQFNSGAGGNALFHAQGGNGATGGVGAAAGGNGKAGLVIAEW